MRRKALLLSFVLLLSGLATATSITQEDVEVDLETMEVTHDIQFNESSSDRMTYIVSHPVEDLYVEIEGEEADCFFDELGVGGEISCETEHSENFNAVIEYRTSGLVSPRNGANVFRFSQDIYRTTDEYNFKVILPLGSGIVDQETVTIPVIEPDNGEVGSEGRRIHVEWSQDPDIGGRPLTFQVIYEGFDRSLRNTLIGVLIVLTVITSAILLRSRKKPSTEDKSHELNEDQSRVIELLEDGGGTMLQKDIVNEMDYSKAKVSSLVSELEEKDLIYKEKEGRSNRVYIK